MQEAKAKRGLCAGGVVMVCLMLGQLILTSDALTQCAIGQIDFIVRCSGPTAGDLAAHQDLEYLKRLESLGINPDITRDDLKHLLKRAKLRGLNALDEWYNEKGLTTPQQRAKSTVGYASRGDYTTPYVDRLNNIDRSKFAN